MKDGGWLELIFHPCHIIEISAWIVNNHYIYLFLQANQMLYVKWQQMYMYFKCYISANNFYMPFKQQSENNKWAPFLICLSFSWPWAIVKGAAIMTARAILKWVNIKRGQNFPCTYILSLLLVWVCAYNLLSVNLWTWSSPPLPWLPQL